MIKIYIYMIIIYIYNYIIYRHIYIYIVSQTWQLGNTIEYPNKMYPLGIKHSDGKWTIEIGDSPS